MIDNYDVVKAYVLAMGEFEDSVKLDFQIQMLVNEILAYCYRKDVPECMELPLADVIVNELNKKGFLSGSIGFDGNVTSYREGDMQISLGGDGVSSTGESLCYGGKLEGFKKIIGAIKCSETTNA